MKLPDYNNRLRVLVATYVTFSPDGTELLVNMGGEQVRRLKSFTLVTAHCCVPLKIGTATSLGVM